VGIQLPPQKIATIGRVHRHRQTIDPTPIIRRRLGAAGVAVEVHDAQHRSRHKRY
jgi:hypothetical protein